MSDALAFLRRAAEQAPPAVPAAALSAAARVHREPSPAGNPMAWADHGACAGMDPDLFYPGRGEGLAPEAAAACRCCDVLAECRDWALHHERHGYWGGMSELARRRLRRTLGIRLDDDPTDTTLGDDAA